MGIDSQGRIDVQGQSAFLGGPFILRIEPNGATDPSFTGGVRSLAGISQPGKIVVQSNGGVLVPLISPYFGTLAVVRLTSTLDADQSFGPNGMASSFGRPLSNGAVYGEALQPDGNIVVAATMPAGQQSAIVMARFLASGQPDTTFGTSGIASGAFDSKFSFDAATYTSDNRIVIVADGSGTLGLEAFVGKSPAGTDFWYCLQRSQWRWHPANRRGRPGRQDRIRRLQRQPQPRPRRADRRQRFRRPLHAVKRADGILAGLVDSAGRMEVARRSTISSRWRHPRRQRSI